jgi:hypothetical protein
MTTIILNSNEVEVDGIKYVKETPKQPEFKEGQWVIGINGYTPYYPARINILPENKNEVKHLYWNGEEEVQSYQSIKKVRLATDSEIETHLREICDKKYVGKKVISTLTGLQNIIMYNRGSHYEKDDTYYIDGIEVYRQGKFAKIVPEKKKLPKTKAELMEFQLAWINDPSITITFEEFLENYKD